MAKPIAIPSQDRLIGSAEVAARLGIHIVTLYKKLDASGERYDPDFPKPIRSMGARLKWRESAIRDFVAAKERESAAA